LGREPDPEGLATFSRYIVENDAAAPDIAALLMGSEEFRSRNPSAVSHSPVELTSLRQSSACVQRDIESATFRRWAIDLKERPGNLHRKLWEWCYICQTLAERDMLRGGRRGLGFAVGQEPLASLFCSMGADVLATDLDSERATHAGWVDTGQHASVLEDLNARGICKREDFAKRARFRVVDMNSVPADLLDFDFVWSSCAIEHLGSLDSGIEFMRRMMKCLNPGGIAVHTTEFNVSSNEKTIEHGRDVIFRRRDLEQMAHVLEADGHRVEPFNFDTGSDPADQIISVHPHTREPVLKFWLGDFVSTSIGIIVTSGSSV
jgi:2-polyprenyl-3-methyl-5-hydroxy-6-metoxy-1,4-benzoquinol methylase